MHFSYLWPYHLLTLGTSLIAVSRKVCHVGFLDQLFTSTPHLASDSPKPTRTQLPGVFNVGFISSKRSKSTKAGIPRRC